MLEAAWPMPAVVVVVMATRVAILVQGLEVLKVVMVMLPVARSTPQPLLSTPQAVAPLEGPIFLKDKPVKSQGVHNSPVVISLS